MDFAQYQRAMTFWQRKEIGNCAQEFFAGDKKENKHISDTSYESGTVLGSGNNMEE